MADAEESIARVQVAATGAQGTDGDKLRQHQTRGVAYLNDRILVFVLAIAFIGLMIAWATATSPLLLYGSLAGVILLTIAWGVARVRRIERIRQERARQAEAWQTEDPQ